MARWKMFQGIKNVFTMKQVQSRKKYCLTTKKLFNYLGKIGNENDPEIVNDDLIAQIIHMVICNDN